MAFLGGWGKKSKLEALSVAGIILLEGTTVLKVRGQAQSCILATTNKGF